MSTWILIIIFGGYKAGGGATTAEFKTEQQCRAAQGWVTNGGKSERHFAGCFPSGPAETKGKK